MRLLVTLTDQTLLITPRHAGQILRFDGANIVTEAEVEVRVQGSGDVELSEGSWWDRLLIVDGVYDGPYFDGDTDLVDIEGVDYRTQWDDEPDASTSSTVLMPATAMVVVERSLDGESWEPVIETADPATVMDWEAWSYGDIHYRATAFTVEGATAVTEIIVEARSSALWLSGGVGFGVTARLPFNPVVQITAGRARALKQYAGRSNPVAIAGEALTRVIAVSGLTMDHDLYDDATADVEALTRLSQMPDALFLFRDPDGRRVFGSIGVIDMTRQSVSSSQGSWNGHWGYSFTLTEAEA